MAIITLPGNTLGCCIGTGSFENVGKAFSNAKTTTNSLKQSLSELKSKVDIAKIAASVK